MDKENIVVGKENIVVGKEDIEVDKVGKTGQGGGWWDGQGETRRHLGDKETLRWTLDSEEKLLVSLLGRVVDTVGQLGRGSDHAANSAALSCLTKLPAEEKREWKVFGIRKIHFFWGQNKKREGWLGSCGTKLESLELIGGNSRPPPSWITWITRYHTSWTSNAHKWIYSSWKKLVTNKSNVLDFVRKHSAKIIELCIVYRCNMNFRPKKPDSQGWQRYLQIKAMHLSLFCRWAVTESRIKPGFWHKDALMAS